MHEKKVDRRVQRTRQIIREALMGLMLEKSYEKITIQEIIDRANVGRATFYNHYQDKDDLLLRGVAEIAYRDEDTAAIANTNPQEIGGSAPDPMSTIGMFAHSRQNDRLHQIMFKRSRENPILEKVTAFLYNHVAAQLGQMATASKEPAVPLPVITHFMTGGLLALIRWWHDQGFPYTAVEMDAFFQQIAMPGTLAALQDSRSLDQEAMRIDEDK